MTKNMNETWITVQPRLSAPRLYEKLNTHCQRQLYELVTD